LKYYSSLKKAVDMKPVYTAKALICSFLIISSLTTRAQVPTSPVQGSCSGVIANFNANDNGYNSPSIYGSIFDSSLYYHAGRGYWTDYLPPYRTTAPGVPRVLNIISPPYPNPNPAGIFTVGFTYIIGNPATDRFQVRIISVTSTPQGTVTNVEATSGVQAFTTWSSPIPYVDVAGPTVPDPTPFLNGFAGNVCIQLNDPDIVNGPNTSFRVEVSYLTSSPTFAVFDNLSIGPIGAPLPVHFIGLVANRSASNTVDLKWDVSEEIDVQEYQVERSTNASYWEVTGTVQAKGKSIYTLTDNNVPSRTIYYRIKSIDIDGRYKYSGVLRLDGDNSYGNEISVYPVPAKDDIIVQHKKLRGKVKMIISSMNGTIVKTIQPTPGSSHTPVNISNLPSGVYLLRLDDETGWQSIKLMKE
jgi:hypothetical protein